MCGICGFVGSHEGFTEDRLLTMNHTMVRRGPDDTGHLFEPGVGLAMRRLSILDLEGGRQPIFNEDGGVAVVFNGEIYNFRELRSDLERRGHRFATRSDTEVIVHLYEEFGDALVHHLRGMFAFALWDRRKRRALIARDRLGIKPLYYAQLGNGLVFGSEIKALLASGVVEPEIDWQAVDLFFTYTYIPNPYSIYRKIRKLPPGHLLIVADGTVDCRQYWDIQFAVKDAARGERYWLDQLESTIGDSVRSHLLSDVPIGAFLSGGVDSGLVVDFMREADRTTPIETFTMGFGGSRNPLLDERPLARQIATERGCHYNEFTVEADVTAIIEEIVDAFDEPFADDSVIPSYYLCKLTSERVKVALSGLGGDEAFGGYQRHSGFALSERYARFPSLLHQYLVNPIVQTLPEPTRGGDRIDHIKRFSMAAMETPEKRYLSFVSALSERERAALYTPAVRAQMDFQKTREIVTAPFQQCQADDNVSRMLYVDLKTYLPEDILALSDRLSMWHSLEVRVPLVDHRVVELAGGLPSRLKVTPMDKKILLKKLARKRLPRAVVDHRKQGFEAPMAAWLRTDLRSYAESELSRERLESAGLFNPAFVRAKLDAHLSGRCKCNKFLFSLIMFQQWLKRHSA
jgi:asparagine synthase (glutamine-hydrolysing)